MKKLLLILATFLSSSTMAAVESFMLIQCQSDIEAPAKYSTSTNGDIQTMGNCSIALQRIPRGVYSLQTVNVVGNNIQYLFAK